MSPGSGRTVEHSGFTLMEAGVCPGFHWACRLIPGKIMSSGVDYSFEALPVIVAPGVVAMKRNSLKE